MTRALGLGILGLAALGAFLTSPPDRAASAPDPPEMVLDLVASVAHMRLTPREPRTPANLRLASARYMPQRSQQAQADTVFRHAQHERVACLSCHSMDPSHGDVRVRTLADCRACHHAPEPARDCASCHDQADASLETFALSRIPSFSTGPAPERTLSFAHAQHVSVGCGSCHTEGPSLSARAATCDGCHVEHHRPEARCATCHVPVLEPPHEALVHVGCGGTGCHTSPGFEVMPRSRASCVACHQTEEEHKPGLECTTCHLLPPPRPPGGTAGSGG